MRRGLTSDHFRVKCGVDYGQYFLKVTLTLTDASLHCAGEQNSSLNGGKKTMLLAVYQDPETYSNLVALFTLLNAPGDLDYVYACDLTVINIAHIPADIPARIARQDRHSGTQTHRYGQFR